MTQEQRTALADELQKCGFTKNVNEQFTWFSKELFKGVPVQFILKNSDDTPVETVLNGKKTEYVHDAVYIDRFTTDLVLVEDIIFEERDKYVRCVIADNLARLIGRLIYEMLFAFENGKTLDEMFTEEDSND